MNNENALIIIAKYPDSARVKTRLSRALTDSERVSFYTSLLEGTIGRLGALKGVDTVIAFAPGDSGDYFSRFGLGTVSLPEGDLGERMYYAFQEIFLKGYTKAALVGVDIPGLSGSIIVQAFELLSRHDVVFGPARDGGYYLIGMKEPVHALFDGVPWSSSLTLKKSIEAAEGSGLSFACTEMLSDIDTIEDMKRSGFYPTS